MVAMLDDPDSGLLAQAMRSIRRAVQGSRQGPKIVRAGLDEFCPHKPWPKQQIFLSLDCEEAFYGGAAGGGKALWIDTPLPTPSGWTTMRDVAPGDYLLDENGSPCQVLACSDVMLNRDCYEVEFSDGSKIIADADHLWNTHTLADRTASSRRTEEFRARRRTTRKRRGTGKKPWLTERNQAAKVATLDPPQATTKTTSQILETLRYRGRVNHSIPVASPLSLPHADLAVDPYVLGTWLGDGHSIGAGFTSADEHILNEIRNAGYVITKRSGKYQYGILSLFRELKNLDVIKNKHVPQIYLRASVNQRLALLQGLMDTDGHACKSGQCEFTTTSPAIRDGVVELLITLGVKAVASEGVATINGKSTGPKWRIKFLANFPAFRLPRKLSRQKQHGFRGTHRTRYIVAVTPFCSVPVKCVRVDSRSHCYLAGREMIPTHNSDTLLMAALQYVHIPGYSALILRRDFARLALSGAIMDRARQWLYNTPAKWNGQDKIFRFPSGASLQFGFIDNPQDRFRYASSEYQFIGWDELTEFALTEDENNPYLFMFSRLRAANDMPVPLRVRSASNPGNIGHAWVKRRFLPTDGAAAGGEVLDGPEGRKFVPALIRDNPAINEENYRRKLLNLPPVTRDRLMLGDWDAAENLAIPGEWLRRYSTRGEHLNWDDHCQIDSRECRRFATIDTAGTSRDKAEEARGKSASWSVCGIWDYSHRHDALFLRHVWRARVGWNELLAALPEQLHAWNVRNVKIEKAHVGPPLGDELRKRHFSVDLVGPMLPGMADGYRGAKLERAIASGLLARMEAGKLRIPEAGATAWLSAYESELTSWSGSAEETTDQIDVSSYAAWEVKKGNGGAAVMPSAITGGRR